jgi:hypothetical protein
MIRQVVLAFRPTGIRKPKVSPFAMPALSLYRRGRSWSKEFLSGDTAMHGWFADHRSARVAIGLVRRALVVGEAVEQLACGGSGLVPFWAERQDGTRSMAASPYGFWTSPITSDLVVGDSIRLEQVALDGDAIYWSETQPQKQGRTFVYRVGADGEPERVTPDDANAFSVRTRTHEYGGGSFAVSDGVVYFSNNLDQRLYRQDAGWPPNPITPAPAGAAADALRYADGVIDPRRRSERRRPHDS